MGVAKTSGKISIDCGDFGNAEQLQRHYDDHAGVVCDLSAAADLGGMRDDNYRANLVAVGRQWPGDAESRCADRAAASGQLQRSLEAGREPAQSGGAGVSRPD